MNLIFPWDHFRNICADRFALVGFGVRKNGVVEDHPFQKVACEILRLDVGRGLKHSVMNDERDAGESCHSVMETVTILPDDEDEVSDLPHTL